MNKVRFGAMLMVGSLLLAIVGGVLAATGQSLWVVGAVLVVAEGSFWLGVLLMGYTTYRAAKARGWRSVPRELWRIKVGGCIESTPAVWKGRLYFGTRAGGIHSLG